ncbi:sensor histidine kinase [Prevotella sp. 10(H)]|uniref:sensor histidine kinase n=1 Tax=Prevotella sp. 10(H) TaxID=1158294 RepID=UPI0018CC1CC4|nr:sensor histidine kinase [Prevotella sp. 10(H)]
MLLLVALGAVSSQQIFVNYEAKADDVGNWIYLIAFIAFLTYLAVTYTNIYKLVPTLLLKKRYLKYAIFFSLSVLMIVLVQIVMEYVAFSLLGTGHRREHYLNLPVIIDSFSTFMLTLICISGSSITVLLRYWMMESERVNELEKIHIQSEVEQLKDQINPTFLFNILSSTSALVKVKPEKASDMLYRLSQLLRYQLYDCSRDKVLLSSEIKFLNNYLALQKLYSDNFSFSVSANVENMNQIFVSPLLFIPFIQNIVNKTEKDEVSFIQIHFETNKNILIFTCSSSLKELNEEGISRIKHRLDLLYKDNYTLSARENKIELKLNL